MNLTTYTCLICGFPAMPPNMVVDDGVPLHLKCLTANWRTLRTASAAALPLLEERHKRTLKVMLTGSQPEQCLIAGGIRAAMHLKGVREV